MEQKDHFPSMLREELSGSSPVAFDLAEYSGPSTERTPEGRLISEDEFREGLVFYRGERYGFRFFPRTERPRGGEPILDYAVVQASSRRDALWSLRDHPRLVFDVVGLKRAPYPWVAEVLAERGEDANLNRLHYLYFAVDEEDMRSFLATYGPLTPSFVPRANGTFSEAMIDEIRMYGIDERAGDLACLFSRPVGELHQVALAAADDPMTGVVRCFGLIERTPPHTLYRALLLQLLEHLLTGNPIHNCEGCGRWFSFTDDETQARHREGWKRHDARYHSRACLKAASERRRRARLRDQEAA